MKDLEIARSWWDPKYEKGLLKENFSLHWFLEEDKEAKEKEVGEQEGQEGVEEDPLGTPKAPKGSQALSGTAKGGNDRKEDEAGLSKPAPLSPAPPTAERRKRAAAPAASPPGKKGRQSS